MRQDRPDVRSGPGAGDQYGEIRVAQYQNHQSPELGDARTEFNVCASASHVRRNCHRFLFWPARATISASCM